LRTFPKKTALDSKYSKHPQYFEGEQDKQMLKGGNMKAPFRPECPSI
jgi:hypothetical protein